MTETHSNPVVHFVKIGDALVDVRRVISVQPSRGRNRSIGGETLVSLDAMSGVQTVETRLSVAEVWKLLKNVGRDA